jgi:hypothetical protein
MSLADDFTKLREHAERGEQEIKAAATESKAKLEARVEGARRNADERAGELRTKAEGTKEQGASQWHEVQSSWDQHVQRVRQRIDEKQAKMDAKAAEHDARWAEDDAANAIAFAESAVEEAEYAALEAMRARADADALAAAQ